MRQEFFKRSLGRRPFLGVAGALAVLLAVTVTPVAALAGGSLDSYRAEGVVAERFDGFVELRAANAPSEARALVEDVNAQRRALYAQRAKESNVSVDQVGKLYATKIAETAPRGTYFRQPNGGYVQK